MIQLQTHFVDFSATTPARGNQDGGRRMQTHAKRNGTVQYPNYLVDFLASVCTSRSQN